MLLQILNFVSVLASGLMIWKGLGLVTNTESPIVVVLRCVSVLWCKCTKPVADVRMRSYASCNAMQSIYLHAHHTNAPCWRAVDQWNRRFTAETCCS